MAQQFYEAFANVLDYGVSTTVATPAEAVTNAMRITGAINIVGRQVMFPAGTYTFSGVIQFATDDQVTTFQAGAMLQPADKESYVLVTGQRQVIEGLRIVAPVNVVAHSPLVEIYGASDLVMEDLRVSTLSMYPSVSGPRAAVRVMCLAGCQFTGGLISGPGEAGTVGLWLAPSYDYDKENQPNQTPGDWMIYPDDAARATAQATSGASEVTARGLAIEEFGWAVRIGCNTDNPTFTGCRFTENLDGAIDVKDDADVLLDTHIRLVHHALLLDAADATATQSVASALTLDGCRFAGGSPPAYIHVQAPKSDGSGGGAIRGGAVVGCVFGSTSEGAASGPVAGQAVLGKGSGGVVGGKRGTKLDGASTQATSKVVSASRGTGGDPTNSATGSIPGAPIAGTSKQGTSKQGPSKPGASKPGASKRASSTHHRVAEQSGGPAQSWHTDVPGEAAPLVPACIFLVEGEATGLVVSGCYSSATAGREYVWVLPASAVVSEAADAYNSWAESTVSTGDNAKQLVQLTTDSSGNLEVIAEEVCFDTETMGFFEDVVPAGGGGAFSAGRSPATSRKLRSSDPETVLAQLLLDLADLGLIKGS